MYNKLINIYLWDNERRMRPNLRKADNSEMAPMFDEILNFLF